MSTDKIYSKISRKVQERSCTCINEKIWLQNVMQAPKLEKICLNRGVNGAVTDKKLVDIAVEELTTLLVRKQ